jgi:biofilm PGA synthesis N-glycosyltransferase PgaC
MYARPPSVDIRGPATAEVVVDRPAVVGGFVKRGGAVDGLRPTVRFALALSLTVSWVAFSVWVSGPWRHELERAVGPLAGWVIPIFLAYVPGFVIGFLVFTLLIARYREPSLSPPSGPWPRGEWPPVTILVAAWNEEQAIVPTLESIGSLAYPGRVEVVLADNHSTDRTAELAAEAAERLGLDYRRVYEERPGKHIALTTALATVTTPLVVTLDADTYLQRLALSFLVARVTTSPQDQHVCACAGALVAENPLATFITRMQQWDYRLGINGVKRMQAAYNTALVAQGAFSIYWTEDVRALGGWPDAIGEDIVLTWRLLQSRGIVVYEPVALGFTSVPEHLGRLMTQRSRWARGMFEGLRLNPPYVQPRVLAKFVSGIDYLVPLLDIGYIFFFVPGVILFVLGYPLIFGWWSMLLIPMTLFIFGFLRHWQERYVFRRLEIRQDRDWRGFGGYLLAYQTLTSSASLRGYAQHFLGSARRWK